jgi:hypothetical protein
MQTLINADKEPHNWLMNHRTYDAQRYSPQEQQGQRQVAQACLCGRTSANENPQSTPLAENGYVVDESMQELWKFNLGSGIMRRR